MIRKNERMLDRFQGRIIRSKLIARPNPRLVRTAEEHVNWYRDQLQILREELRNVEKTLAGAARLRKAEKNDIRRIWQWSSRTDVLRMSYRPAHPLEKWIEDFNRWTGERDSFPFAICKPNGDLIGFLVLGMHRYPGDERTGQLDYVIIGEEYREYGYGTEAVRAAVCFARDELDMNKVGLWTVTGNNAAIRCFEKCGFKFTDVVRNAIADNGKLCDMYQMVAGHSM